ncbi:MAG: hypothetical protein GY701_30245 [Sulfitobacter sp.]|nr:hypothetical protein [Sulfitobacter sp.]
MNPSPRPALQVSDRPPPQLQNQRRSNNLRVALPFVAISALILLGKASSGSLEWIPILVGLAAAAVIIPVLTFRARLDAPADLGKEIKIHARFDAASPTAHGIGQWHTSIRSTQKATSLPPPAALYIDHDGVRIAVTTNKGPTTFAKPWDELRQFHLYKPAWKKALWGWHGLLQITDNQGGYLWLEVGDPDATEELLLTQLRPEPS